MKDPLHWPPGAPFAVRRRARARARRARARETYDIPAAYWLQALVVARDRAGRLRARGAAGGRVGGRRGGRAGRLLPAADPRDGRADLRAAGRVLAHARLPALRGGRAAGAGVAVRGRRASLLGGRGADPRRPAARAVRARPAGGAVDLARGRRPRHGLVVGGAHPRRGGAGDRAVERLRSTARGSSCRSRAGRRRRCSSAPTCRATAHGRDEARARCGGEAAQPEAARHAATSTSRRARCSRWSPTAIPTSSSTRRSRWRRGATSRATCREDPVGYAGMMLNKVQRMWSRYARGGARHTSPFIRGWHILLVLARLRRARARAIRAPLAAAGAILAAALTSTAIHMLVVSQARYNLPLMPALLAGGVAGWVMFLRGQRAAAAGPEAASIRTTIRGRASCLRSRRTDSVARCAAPCSCSRPPRLVAPASASAAVTPIVTRRTIAAALSAPAAAAVTAAQPSRRSRRPATRRAISDGPLGGFPTNGSSFAVLSSGDALNADRPSSPGRRERRPGRPGEPAARRQRPHDPALDLRAPGRRQLRWPSLPLPHRRGATAPTSTTASSPSSRRPDWTATRGRDHGAEQLRLRLRRRRHQRQLAGLDRPHAEQAAGTASRSPRPADGRHAGHASAPATLSFSIFDQGDTSSTPRSSSTTSTSRTARRASASPARRTRSPRPSRSPRPPTAPPRSDDTPTFAGAAGGGRGDAATVGVQVRSGARSRRR